MLLANQWWTLWRHMQPNKISDWQVWSDYRKIKLTVRKYFNQRLLHADGRFTRDIKYLLTAQYAVESKQVADNASITLRQTQGRLHRRQVLTAGCQKPASYKQDGPEGLCLSLPEEYVWFTSILPENHVWCLGMIRQLEIPTWFLALSAVARCNPDNSQTVRHQTFWRRCEINIIWREEQVAETESSHCCQALPVSS